MIYTDVLVIGGSAAGLVTATTVKSNYPEKKVTVLRKEKDVLVPCGIPYIFGSLDNSDQNLVPDAKLSGAGVDLIVGTAEKIDIAEKTCNTSAGDTISFSKIVLATGSVPKIPTWLKGSDLKNVFTVPKDRVYLDILADKIKDKSKVVVIGGGFIGVEMSDELNKGGKEVVLVEVLPHILGAVFDEDAAVKAENALIERGVKVKTGSGIKEIKGNGTVESILLESGEEIDAEAVVLSMGYSPNNKLAEDAGIELNQFNQIVVDSYMRTENKDVFAVGDCAAKRDFITTRSINTMLASTACAEARVAGMNMFSLMSTKNFQGTIALFSTGIGEQAFAVAGLTYSKAKAEGLTVFKSKFEGPDKHPGKMPGTQMQSVELVISEHCGRILGGTVVGGRSAGEVVNIIGLAIQTGLTVFDIVTAQIGTHPLLTSPPTAYPLIKAAEKATKHLR